LEAVILDTNAISAMAEGDTDLERILPDVPWQFIPVICLGEYRAGVIRSRAREELEKWLRELEESRRVLLVERETAKFYADIVADLRSRGCMIPMNDVWIAALALQHDLPVLSRDEHFDQVKRLRRIPW
jgi:tRNA(fMet)-specific endonuclease VapC